RAFGRLDLVEPDAHRRGVAECDHVSVTNCDLGAASWERLEIFADRRGTDIERRAGRAVQKAVGGLKLYDCNAQRPMTAPASSAVPASACAGKSTRSPTDRY